MSDEALWDASAAGNGQAFAQLYERHAEIYVMNADGSGQTNVTRTATTERCFAWSSDSRKLVFVRGSDVVLVNADGSGKQVLTASSGP